MKISDEAIDAAIDALRFAFEERCEGSKIARITTFGRHAVRIEYADGSAQAFAKDGKPLSLFDEYNLLPRKVALRSLREEFEQEERDKLTRWDSVSGELPAIIAYVHGHTYR